MLIRILPILLMLASAAFGSEPDDPSAAPPDASQTEAPRQMGWGLGRLARAARELSKLGDWQDQAPNIDRSLDRLWEENEWDGESDQFALELVRGVAEIPPWEIARRIEHLTGGIGARYEMTEAQRGKLQGEFYQFIGAMAAEHGGTMLNHVSEMVERYQAGKPVTPEDVARWVGEGDEMFEFANARFQKLAASVGSDMNEQQRALFDRDFASYQKRVERLEDMRERWKAGGWHPRDWGLDEYGMYKRMMDERTRDGRYDEQKWKRFDEEQQVRRELRKRQAGSPHDESVWEKYVREFIAKYALDDAQSETAWSILRELKLRAEDVRRSAAGQRAKSVDAKASLALAISESESIQRLFEALCARLDRIPTNAQRAAVQSKTQPTDQAPVPTP